MPAGHHLVFNGSALGIKLRLVFGSVFRLLAWFNQRIFRTQLPPHGRYSSIFLLKNFSTSDPAIFALLYLF